MKASVVMIPTLVSLLLSADPTPPPSDTVFVREISPFLATYCHSCHNPKKEAGELDLTRYRTEADILRDRKTWSQVVRQLKAGAMPPAGRRRPPESEVRSVVAWIEETLTRIDPSKPLDPGRVTARRLNRTEYDNTIRDLFGVVLHLADEFPADDLGYGFDNIGDVLSISPLRMEQYLNAAERLTAVLLGTTDEPVYDEFTEAVFFKFDKKPRNASDRGWELIPGSENYLEFEFPAPGEYEVRLHAWGVEKPEENDRDNNERWLEAEANFRPDPNALPPVEATVLCDDRVIGHVPVLPGNGTTAINQIYRLRFTTQAGVHTIRIRHRFPRHLTEDQIAEHLRKPLLAPRLGLRRVGLRGPFGVGDATLTAAHRALREARPTDAMPAPEAARRALRVIADRAWRRPVTEAELDELCRLVMDQHTRGLTFTEALERGVQAILVSPRFLYRMEVPPRESAPAAPLDDYSLASRLSYFLWSSMPDDELFALAAQGRLQDPAVLTAQVQRMLDDPRSEAFIEGFFGQWLGLRKLPDVSVDLKLFPDFSTELRDDLRRETTLFVTALVRDNLSALDMLTADYTYVNGRLAKFYGLPGVDKATAEFRRVSLAGTARQGILTHAGILLLTSYPNRTSPTRRGNWVLETILGEEPPPPPDNVPELEQTQAAAPDLPLRQQLERHRTDATCASCHRVIDAIGFGLENFDAIGRWRDRDRGQPIDPSGDLPSGEHFRSPRELIDILAKRDEDFARHLASRLLTYALGRGVEYYDRPARNAIVDHTRTEGFRFRDMIREVVLSRPFRWQRITETQELSP
jgi:hypothetical protein